MIGQVASENESKDGLSLLGNELIDLDEKSNDENQNDQKKQKSDPKNSTIFYLF